MNNYLIPANSKKSLLYFGLFNQVDLIIFGIGIFTTFLLVFIVPLEAVWGVVLALAPAFICGFMVMPVPNYHNTRTLIKSIYRFYTERRSFIWKGWCVTDGKGEK